MQNLNIESHSPYRPVEIYLIIRVFNLGKDSMGLRVYFDPESLRKSGELVFTEESWSVVPGVPSSQRSSWV